jgi:hypothetical protein
MAYNRNYLPSKNQTLKGSEDGVQYSAQRVCGLCPSSGILENTTFRKLDLFPFSGVGRETPTLLGPLERVNVNH